MILASLLKFYESRWPKSARSITRPMTCMRSLRFFKPCGNQLARSSRVSHGFTLIEIMVAIAIFALIAAIAFPALIQFLDIRERINQKNESINSLQKTFLFMSRDLSFAVNRLGKDEFGDLAKSTMLVGEDSLLEVTTSYQDFNLDGAGIPRRVKWVLEDKVLYRVQYPVMDPDGDTRIYRQALLSDVDDVEVKVFSIEDGRDSESKRWKEEERLPNMVKVTVEMANGIDYERAFTMLGGDRKEAEEISQQATQGNQSNPNADSPEPDSSTDNI